MNSTIGRLPLRYLEMVSEAAEQHRRADRQRDGLDRIVGEHAGL